MILLDQRHLAEHLLHRHGGSSGVYGQSNLTIITELGRRRGVFH